MPSCGWIFENLKRIFQNLLILSRQPKVKLYFSGAVLQTLEIRSGFGINTVGWMD
jgi:hypothetical protein